jgi:hypothetical protein
MARILRNDWKTNMLNMIDNPNFEFKTSISIATTWLVIQLSDRNLDYRIINLGAGVKLITRKTDICPKCHGTGKI